MHTMAGRCVLPAVLALLALWVAPAAADRVAIGMGEQEPSMFSDPRWERLGLRHAR